MTCTYCPQNLRADNQSGYCKSCRHRTRLLYFKQYKKTNPSKYSSYTAKRKAKKLQATPSWLTKTQLDEIQSYYDLAQELQWLSEEQLQVDHIEPLQGKDVHVPWNLQILPKLMNCSKSNKKVG